MKMVGSTSSLDHYTDLFDKEKNTAIPLKCWHNFYLPNIWIPSHLLSTRNKAPQSQEAHHGLFHKLEKDSSAKCIESFSLYSNIDIEKEEGDIFENESDDDLLLSGESNNSDKDIKNCAQQLSENKVTKTISIFPSSQVCNDERENSEFHNLYKNLMSCRKSQYLEPKISKDVTDDAMPEVLNNLTRIELQGSHSRISEEPEKVLNKAKDESDFRFLKLGNVLTNENKDRSDSQFSEQKDVLSTNNVKDESDSRFSKAGNVLTNENKDRSDSQFLLNELLDPTPEIDIRNISFDLKSKDAGNLNSSNVIQKKEELYIKKSNKKERKNKKKYSQFSEQEDVLSTNNVKDESDSRFSKAGNVLTNENKDKSDSQFLLNELLDPTPEIDIRNFSFDLKSKDAGNLNSSNVIQKKEELYVKKSNKKERKEIRNSLKNKKKASKYISLDQFLEDGVEEENCFEEFYRNILLQKNGGFDSIALQDKIEFPGLISEEPIFIKSGKSEEKANCEENQEIGLKSLVHILTESSEVKRENEKEYEEKTLNTENEATFGKIVLENIPLGTSEEDVRSLFFGYGEIKKFSLESTGKSFKASVEMDLICDIDWIVECLNGSEPFGASSETLKCYDATSSS